MAEQESSHIESGIYERAKETLEWPTPGLDARIAEIKIWEMKAHEIRQRSQVEKWASEESAAMLLWNYFWWVTPMENQNKQSKIPKKWESIKNDVTPIPSSSINNNEVFDTQEQQRKEKEQILYNIRWTKVQLGEKVADLDISKISLEKKMWSDRYILKSIQTGFEYIQPPWIEVKSNGEITIPNNTITLKWVPWAAKLVWISDGTYRTSMEWKTLKVTRV